VAAEAARRCDAVRGLLLWQPILSGKRHLRQFLRIEAAGEMLAGEGMEMGIVERLQAELARGDPVEVAGYTLNAGLARGLEGAELALPERPLRVEWLELAATRSGGLSPSVAGRLEEWRAQGYAVRGAAVCGPPFWQTAEIAECPELLAATLAALSP
jgi:exosortase A-associated hydrolase 2